MKSTRLGQLLATARDSFWFFPALCMVVAVVLVEALTLLDHHLDLNQYSTGWLLLQAGPDGSRSLLDAIATSMLGAAATAFSITVAVLALTSSSYGPRLVRNVMSDRVNQLVLGILVGTALYALLLLRHIRVLDPTSDDEAFVPHLSVNVAVLLAVVSISALVYFIHHISASIQVSTLSGSVVTRTASLVEELYPPEAPDGCVAGLVLVSPEDADREVLAASAGYVQGIDGPAVLHAAQEHGARVEVVVRAGDFLLPGDVVALVRADAGRDAHDVGEDVCEAVLGAVLTGAVRTPYQDIGALVQQHVDLVVRALSPGTNDPVTAMNGLDHLSAGLALLVQRPDAPWSMRDDDGRPRVRLARVSAAELVSGAVDAVRGYAAGHTMVVLRLLDLLERVGVRCSDPGVTLLVREELDLVVAGHGAAATLEHDRERVRQRADEVRHALAPLLGSSA